MRCVVWFYVCARMVCSNPKLPKTQVPKSDISGSCRSQSERRGDNPKKGGWGVPCPGGVWGFPYQGWAWMGRVRGPGRFLGTRSEEHTSELQSRGLISYAVFCLKKK